MTPPKFILSPHERVVLFRDQLDWSDHVKLCTARLDTERETAPFWTALRQNLHKVRQLIVPLRGSETSALQAVHKHGALRLFTRKGSAYRANVYLFFRDDSVHAL